MSCINRIWVAAGVAAVNSHSDQGKKLKSLNHHGKKRFFSGNSDAADFGPFSGVMNSDIGGFLGCFRRGDDKRKQSEESLREVMYMNCWGQG